MTALEKALEAARIRYIHAAGSLSPSSPEFDRAIRAYWAELAQIKETHACPRRPRPRPRKK